MVQKISRAISFTLIASLLLLAVPAAVSAKSTCGDIDEMASGDSRDDTISKKNYAQVYCFIGVEGEEVTVDMTATSGNLDPYLAIADITGDNILAENDNISKKNTDSEIVYTLESDGAYVILATRKSGKTGTSTGNYTVTFESSGGGSGNADLSTISMFDDSITVSYPSELAFLAGSSDASATIGSDKAALKAKPSALKKGQYQISFDVLSFDSVQTIADALAKNKNFADIVKKIGKKASPWHLVILEMSLLTDATLIDSNEVSLGNLDVVKATWEHEAAVNTVAYAFKTDSGDFMLVTGHVAGNSTSFDNFQTFLEALVESIAFS